MMLVASLFQAQNGVQKKRKRLAVDTGDFEGVDGAGAGASESVSGPRKLRKCA